MREFARWCALQFPSPMGINGRSDHRYTEVSLSVGFGFRPRWGLTAVLTLILVSCNPVRIPFPSPMGINGRSDLPKKLTAHSNICVSVPDGD